MSSKLRTFNGDTITLGQIPLSIELIENTSRTLLLCGAPGIGKSAVIYQYAKSKGYKLFVFTGGLITKNNIYGVDFINPDTKACIHYPAEWYREALNHEGKVLLFLDDFANANPQEMMILQQLLGDRKLGGYDLPLDKFLIIGATNRQQDNANVYTISNPILSRCCVLQINLSIEEYLEYCKDNCHPSIYAFLKTRNWAISDDVEFLQQNKVPEEARSYGTKESITNIIHPCPRTWQAISDMLYSYQINVLNDKYINIFKSNISGLIGNALSPLFIKSLKTTLNIPSIQHLVDNCNSNVDYSTLISSDHEAISSIIFTIYQEINNRLITYNNLKCSGNLKPSLSPKGAKFYIYEPVTELFNVLNKIKETDFKTVNTNAVINSIFDKFSSQQYDNFISIIELTKNVPYFKEFMKNKSEISSCV